jgi:isoleucyl-tRNA synthetase
MKAYRLYTVMPALVKFGTQLTNWYVRLNRDRLKGLEGDGEQQAEAEAELGLQILYDVLLDVTIVMAPFTPFITEFFYQHLRKLHPAYADAANGGGSSNPAVPGKSDSVHFLKMPEYDESRLNQDAVDSMDALQSIVEQGRYAREKRNISLRTPVKLIAVVLRNPGAHVVESLTGPMKKYVLSELNAWEFTVVPAEQEHDWVTLSLIPNFKALGKKVGSKMPAVKSAVNGLSHEVRWFRGCRSLLLYRNDNRPGLIIACSFYLCRMRSGASGKASLRWRASFWTRQLNLNQSWTFHGKATTGKRPSKLTGLLSWPSIAPKMMPSFRRGGPGSL